MKLYIKQKVFSWGAQFRIYDENENDCYSVKGEVFSFGKKLHLYGPDGNELAYIHQKVMSFLPRYFINRNGEDIAQVVKEIAFFRQKYSVEGLGWSVEGNVWAHEYNIYSGSGVVAQISKHWFTWGDTYEIDIADGVDEVMAVSVVLIIDAVIDSEKSSSASSND